MKMANDFGYYYSMTLLGWDKIQAVLYSLQEYHLNAFSALSYNYGDLCEEYSRRLKKRIYKNPLSIKRYKEYAKYNKLVKEILVEYKVACESKLAEIHQAKEIQQPERVVIKGFKRYDE